MTSQDVSLQLFSYTFDGFVTAFFTPVISGAKVVLLNKDALLDIETISEAIVKNGVTHFISVPPLYREIIENIAKEDTVTLKTVTLAGDNVPFKLLELTREKNDGIEIANEYGVTEASVMSTILRRQDKDGPIAIGKPIWNTAIYVVDNRLRLQPVEVPGELCIAGPGLARGYLNRPGLTAERFIFYRSYKTGDLGRWLSDGNLQFLGRIDTQVKVRGFRIELGEIENCLLRHSKIKEAVVLAGGEKGDLCAYVVSSEELSLPGLREYLAKTLPGYMIPLHFVPMEKIPLTPNGKLDRGALPEPSVVTGEQYAAPRSEIEKKLAAIWSEILGIDKDAVGIDANFFDLGGHSLHLIKMNTKVKASFNKHITVGTLFRLSTVRALAAYLQGDGVNLQASDEMLDEAVESLDTTLGLLAGGEDNDE